MTCNAWQRQTLRTSASCCGSFSPQSGRVSPRYAAPHKPHADLVPVPPAPELHTHSSLLACWLASLGLGWGRIRSPRSVQGRFFWKHYPCFFFPCDMQVGPLTLVQGPPQDPAQAVKTRRKGAQVQALGLGVRGPWHQELTWGKTSVSPHSSISPLLSILPVQWHGKWHECG